MYEMVRRFVLASILLVSCTEDPPVAPPPTAPPASAPVVVAPASAPVVVAAKPVRRFLKVEGEVTLDGKPAAVDLEIPATGKLKTGKGARAVMTLEKGGVIEVRENADVEIGASPKRKISLKVAAGIIWSLLPTGKSDYEVVTPNAVAGARGTTFFVNATQKGVSMICVCDGDVEIGAEHVHTNDEHWGYKVVGKKKPKLVGKLKDMPNHPNADRAGLRKLLD